MPDTAALLRADEPVAAWVAELTEAEAGADARVEVGLPAGDRLAAVLLDLSVPHEDVNELLSTRSALLADPVLRELFERAVRVLVADLGTPTRRRPVPPLPAAAGGAGRWFHVYVYVAALPHVLAHHRALGIPPEVSRRTLADLGRHLALHRRRHGSGGLSARHWPGYHFRGELYQLGRLQFQRSTMRDRAAASATAFGLDHGPDDPALELHIPDFLGPMSPAACDESLDLARAFFPRHYPEERYAVAVCGSWLLDPQLREYLPPESNIIRFQRRFHLYSDPTGPRPEDTAPIGFVFGDPGLPVPSLPRDTSLQRAIGDHLRAGRHWHVRTGWFEL
ncbi:acyltransferase domain-containing protein [Embleya scabrispora]|uniref:acyltransferase domain-containing protein n=1 Tax=Embleya scabrispora TaxID=159449 RepID=UPI001911E463|nr:acyltransferase domain-containing protein [Embleya scabrispora]